ncbi:diadenylate cyclase CdaA [uncultured Tyzzerella sp.]|uniref:diadenylate cyclase CdaA n=1 Tax=uncultured Tyzzerella sp. TaxID=2321398 RepID=UPI002942C26F|nr:diadenylate cyclase CdaA [uncultured Tyzzerella sp.]
MSAQVNSNISGVSMFFEGLNLSKLSIPSIRISDVVDILIVAIFIYIIMNWIRETRAWSLFKGMLVILILSILSFRLNLYTTYWIIQETFSVGVMAILILFQPEFRKGLEQIGKGSLTKNIFNNNSQEHIIPKNILDEILTACFVMGKSKTGAIIVVEQNVALGDFEESGIPIDAIVTNQLLINIFENKTPLHDGAVLIRNNRIKRATCILPLTQSEIGLDLGTRHRASVGASEVSDAYIFVVSEETGSVSIAHNGKLYRNLTRQQIEDMFKQHQKQNAKKINIWKGRG